MNNVNIHHFDSTYDAYNESQVRDDINDGDVLAVESERVVGILVGAWPVAITKQHGRFHYLKEGTLWKAIPTSQPIVDVEDYSASYDIAAELVKQWNIEEAERRDAAQPRRRRTVDLAQGNEQQPFRTPTGQTGPDAYEYEAAQIANAQRDLDARFHKLLEAAHSEHPELFEFESDFNVMLHGSASRAEAFGHYVMRQRIGNEHEHSTDAPQEGDTRP